MLLITVGSKIEKKQKDIMESDGFSIRSIGYEDDNKGALVIGVEKPINCVTKMPNVELEELIHRLNNLLKDVAYKKQTPKKD